MRFGLGGDKSWVHGISADLPGQIDHGRAEGKVGAAQGDRVHARASRRHAAPCVDQVRRLLGPRARVHRGRSERTSIAPPMWFQVTRLARDRVSATWRSSSPGGRDLARGARRLAACTSCCCCRSSSSMGGPHASCSGTRATTLPLIPILALYARGACRPRARPRTASVPSAGAGRRRGHGHAAPGRLDPADGRVDLGADCGRC